MITFILVKKLEQLVYGLVDRELAKRAQSTGSDHHSAQSKCDGEEL